MRKWGWKSVVSLPCCDYWQIDTFIGIKLTIRENGKKFYSLASLTNNVGLEAAGEDLVNDAVAPVDRVVVQWVRLWLRLLVGTPVQTFIHAFIHSGDLLSHSWSRAHAIEPISVLLQYTSFVSVFGYCVFIFIQTNRALLKNLICW